MYKRVSFSNINDCKIYTLKNDEVLMKRNCKKKEN